MRLGLPDTMRFGRYGTFWEAYLGALGVELLRPERPLAESLEAGERLMPGEPPTIQLFVGRVLELAPGVDGLLVPDLNPGAEPSGRAEDPWAVDLPAVLARRLSLPPLHRVPARLDEAETGGVAVRLGQGLVRNAQVVRRALDKTQVLLRPARPTEPRWGAGSRRTVGLAGDPALLEQPFLWPGLPGALEAAGLHAVPAAALPPERAAEVGRRARPDLVLGTDFETVGGAALLTGKAAVRGLVVLVEPRRPAAARLASEIVERAAKPALALEVGPNLEPELREFAERL